MMTEQSALLREATRQSFVTFVERVIPHMIPGYLHYSYVDLIAANIEGIMDPNRGGQLVVNLPPRHAKS